MPAEGLSTATKQRRRTGLEGSADCQVGVSITCCSMTDRAEEEDVSSGFSETENLQRPSHARIGGLPYIATVDSSYT